MNVFVSVRVFALGYFIYHHSHKEDVSLPACLKMAPDIQWYLPRAHRLQSENAVISKRWAWPVLSGLGKGQ
jgi:hypothetical protein